MLQYIFHFELFKDDENLKRHKINEISKDVMLTRRKSVFKFLFCQLLSSSVIIDCYRLLSTLSTAIDCYQPLLSTYYQPLLSFNLFVLSMNCWCYRFRFVFNQNQSCLVEFVLSSWSPPWWWWWESRACEPIHEEEP